MQKKTSKKVIKKSTIGELVGMTGWDGQLGWLGIKWKMRRVCEGCSKAQRKSHARDIHMQRQRMIKE